MTYNTLNPPRCISQSVGADGGDIWLYKDGDSLDDVSDVDYISNAADLGMVAGDRVIHVDETDLVTTDLTVVTHRTSGTAVGALCSAIEPIAETSIALQSAGTGTFLIDDVINFDNDLNTDYRLTTGDADISGGGTLVLVNISGGTGLAVATAVGTKITIKSGVLNLSTGKSGRKVHASSPATRLIQPSESGDLFLMDSAAGQVFTLPTAVIGLKYSFLVTVDLTAAAYSVVSSTAVAGDFMVGALNGAIEGAATGEVHFANGTTHIGMSMNKTTTGGLIGGWMELECISATLWMVTGVQSCTATPATPFTT